MWLRLSSWDTAQTLFLCPSNFSCMDSSLLEILFLLYFVEHLLINMLSNLLSQRRSTDSVHACQIPELTLPLMEHYGVRFLLYVVNADTQGVWGGDIELAKLLGPQVLVLWLVLYPIQCTSSPFTKLEQFSFVSDSLQPYGLYNPPDSSVYGIL